MAPIKVFATGITGYLGGTFFDLWLNKTDTLNDFSIRALVRSAVKAEQDIRPLGVEPVIGSLDDTDLLTREASDADVVLDFADADHLPAAKAILKGLCERRKKGGRSRPILIHTSGTGVLTDSAYGAYASEDIYYDNDVDQLSTLAIEQPHRNVDLEILSPSLVGCVDTYIVAPPMIFGCGTGPGNRNSIQIPLQVKASLRNGQALQIGQGLNIWSKVHVIDLAHFFILLLERTLQEPQSSGEPGVDNKGHVLPELPKNQDAYWFCEDGEFAWGSVAQAIAREFVRLGINDSGEVQATSPEEEGIWPPNSHPGALIGANSRSRAVKAREILGWEPQYHDLDGYITEEVERQHKDGKHHQ
ncbi:hypothetical protein CPC16_006240 [Podila verticillata]|nr:hypothetical protein CPC16_006240 [Podila verticillata]